MPMFDLFAYDAAAEEQIKGDARMSMFLALRSAFKERSAKSGIKAKDLAAVLKKNKGHVSRVLNGTNPSMTFETLLVYLEALGFTLTLRPVKIEDIVKTNRDSRPFSNLNVIGVPSGSFYSGIQAPAAGSVSRAGI